MSDISKKDNFYKKEHFKFHSLSPHPLSHLFKNIIHQSKFLKIFHEGYFICSIIRKLGAVFVQNRACEWCLFWFSKIYSLTKARIYHINFVRYWMRWFFTMWNLLNIDWDMFLLQIFYISTRMLKNFYQCSFFVILEVIKSKKSVMTFTLHKSLIKQFLT